MLCDFGLSKPVKDRRQVWPHAGESCGFLVACAATLREGMKMEPANVWCIVEYFLRVFRFFEAKFLGPMTYD